jgi:hypothetical protein
MQMALHSLAAVERNQPFCTIIIIIIIEIQSEIVAAQDQAKIANAGSATNLMRQ